MDIDLERFGVAYDSWVRDSLPDFERGDVHKVIQHYPFLAPDGIPWSPYAGDLAEQRIALVSTAGLYVEGRQAPFETASIHGDPSMRAIPRSVRSDELAIAHAHYDHTLAREDLNTVFPIDRLLELENEGIVGGVADESYSFSYVNDVRPLVRETLPAMISRLEEQQVDVVLLVPV